MADYPSRKEEHKNSRHILSRPTALFFKSGAATEREVLAALEPAIRDCFEIDDQYVVDPLDYLQINVGRNEKQDYALIGRTYVKLLNGHGNVSLGEFGGMLLGEIEMDEEDSEARTDIQAEPAKAFDLNHYKNMSWADMMEEEEEEEEQMRKMKKYYPPIPLGTITVGGETSQPEVMRAVAKPPDNTVYDLKKLCVKNLPDDFLSGDWKSNLRDLYSFFRVHVTSHSANGSLKINILPPRTDKPGQNKPLAFVVFPAANNDIVFCRFMTHNALFKGKRLNVQLSYLQQREFSNSSDYYIDEKIFQEGFPLSRKEKQTRGGVQTPRRGPQGPRSNGGWTHSSSSAAVAPVSNKWAALGDEEETH